MSDARWLEDLVNRLPDEIVWEADAAALTVTFVSPNAEAILGHPVARWLGEPDFWASRIHADDREATLRRVREETGAARDHAVEYRMVHARGRVLWFRHRLFLVRDAGGRVWRLRGVMLDITEARVREARLAAEHAVTRTLAESATLPEATPGILRAVCETLGWDLGALWTVDRAAGVLRCVDVWQTGTADAEFAAYCRQLAFAPGVGLPGRVWARGKPVWIVDVTQDTNFPRASAAVRAGLHGAFGFPIRLGAELLGVVEFFSRNPRDPDEGLLQMMASIGSQIGQFVEREQAEAERARSLERERTARAAAEAAERRAAFLARAGTVLAASLDYATTLAALARLAVPQLGDWCAVDVLEDDGTIRRMAVSHADPRRADDAREIERSYPLDPGADHPIVRALKTGRPEMLSSISAQEVLAITRSEAHYALLERLGLRSYMTVPMVARRRTLGAISFAAAAPGRFGAADLALAEDLADRAAAAVDNAWLYREAEAANRAKDLFLATLSHELRTPLTAILGWVQLLRTGRLEEAVRGRALVIIERNAQTQAQLINDLLDISRIITGKLELDIQPLDLRTVVEAAIETVRPAATAKGVRLVPHLGAPLAVTGDPDRLQQVVWNLLTNAIKFTPAGGEVEVRIGAGSSREAELVVRDTGQGISPQFLPFVFERFRQADSSSSRVHGGLGLGLAIVRHLVELHGGSVTAGSPGEGHGATFVVRLPRLAPAAAPGVDEGEPRKVPIAAPLAGIRVLVVDDENDTRDLLGAILGLAGAEVTVTRSVPEALEAIARVRPHVLVSDVAMPGEDGYALIQKVRAGGGGHGDIPAVAVTAYARGEDRLRALAAGYQRHVAKPIHGPELVAAVAGLARAKVV